MGLDVPAFVKASKALDVATPVSGAPLNALDFPIINGVSDGEGHGYTQLGAPVIDERYFQSAGIARLADGRGMVVVRVGVQESGTEGWIEVCYTTDDTWRTWTEPEELLIVSGRDLRDPSAVTLASGRTIVTYIASGPTSAGRTHSMGMIWTDDGGVTWTDHREDYTFDPFTGAGRTCAPPVELADGSLVWPIYGWDSGDVGIAAGGTTPKSAGVALSNGGLEPGDWTFQLIADNDATHDWNENWVVLCADDSLLHCSCDRATKLHYFHRSTDDGATWSIVGGGTPVVVDGQARGDMVVTSSGRVYLHTRRGADGAAIQYWSDDHGDSWSPDADGAGTTATGQRTDQRRDSTGSSLFNYAQAIEYRPGLIALAQCAWLAGPGSELQLLWVFEKAGVAPSGEIVVPGDLVVPGARYDEPNLVMRGFDGTKFRLFFDSKNRLRYRLTAMPANDTAGSTSIGTIRASKTWDPGSIADGAILSTTVTVSGAALGDFALASFSLALPDGMTISAYVSATNQARVTLRNNTGGAVDLASGTLAVAVL